MEGARRLIHRKHLLVGETVIAKMAIFAEVSEPTTAPGVDGVQRGPSPHTCLTCPAVFLSSPSASRWGRADAFRYTQAVKAFLQRRLRGRERCLSGDLSRHASRGAPADWPDQLRKP